MYTQSGPMRGEPSARSVPRSAIPHAGAQFSKSFRPASARSSASAATSVHERMVCDPRISEILRQSGRGRERADSSELAGDTLGTLRSRPGELPMPAELFRVGDIVVYALDLRSLSDADIVTLNGFANVLSAEVQ